VEIPVVENEKVKAGTVLLRLDDVLARNRLREAEADLRASRAQLTQARIQVEQHPFKLLEQADAVKATTARLEAARNIARHKTELARTGYTSSEEARAADSAVRELEAAVDAEENKLKEVKLAQPGLMLERAEADLEAREARRAQAVKALDECIVRAPQDGTIIRLQTRVGTLLAPGQPQPPILFCADEERVIRAEVEQEFAAQATVGQEAIIHDDSNTATTWRGRVLSISDWYSRRRSMLQEPFQFNDVRTLECLIALEPNQPPLRIGQRVRVTLVKAR
jgi:multidrug resistance efflux pump